MKKGTILLVNRKSSLKNGTEKGSFKVKVVKVSGANVTVEYVGLGTRMQTRIETLEGMTIKKEGRA